MDVYYQNVPVYKLCRLSHQSCCCVFICAAILDFLLLRYYTQCLLSEFLALTLSRFLI